MKTCKICQEEKEENYFPFYSFTQKGKKYTYLRNTCKKCSNKSRDERRKRNGISDTRKISQALKNKKYANFHRELINEYSRNKSLEYNYNITKAEKQLLFNEQNGCCRICGYKEPENAKGTVQKLHVDHCHTTGKVRGLLCNNCNTGIGRLKDSIEILKSAIIYLESFS